jgi:hypothetical protein
MHRRWNDYWVPLDVVVEFAAGVHEMALTELSFRAALIASPIHVPSSATVRGGLHRCAICRSGREFDVEKLCLRAQAEREIFELLRHIPSPIRRPVSPARTPGEKKKA